MGLAYGIGSVSDIVHYLTTYTWEWSIYFDLGSLVIKQKPL
jgi:hypothetical protein